MNLERARLYGLPHVGAQYTKQGTARSYERTQEWCFICGRPSTNCHHVVPLGNGEFFKTYTANGSYELRSPLFSLCGSGTTGCHGLFHSRVLIAVWEWDTPEFANAWEKGELLDEYSPHHEALYDYGQWVIQNKQNGNTIRYRRNY